MDREREGRASLECTVLVWVWGCSRCYRQLGVHAVNAIHLVRAVYQKSQLKKCANSKTINYGYK